MSLHTQIHVARRFQRSVRIDTDLNNPKALEGFICPKSSGDVILSMARHISETGQAAFTWTGPYGSGKSSLVIALSALLSGNDKVRQKALEAVGKSVANPVWNSLPPKSKGWNIIPVVGRRAAAAEVIGEAISASGLIGPSRNKDWDDSRVIASLERIVDETQKHHGGVIVFLDEMGKFLEGAAHDGHDVYIFQRLAEAASRSNGKLVVVGILHQAFDEYPEMLVRLRVMMLSELLVPNASSQSFADLRDRAQNIQQLTGDFRLNAFIGRLTTFTGSEQDMEGIASLAVNKPARDWTDSDLDQAAIEITELSQKFIRAETFARVKGRDTKRQAMAVMVGIDGRPTPISGEFAISSREQIEVDSLVAKISRSLSDFPAEKKNIL